MSGTYILMAKIALGERDEGRRLRLLDSLAAHAEIIGQRGPSRSLLVCEVADAYEKYPEETAEHIRQIRLLAAMAVADKVTDMGRNDPAT